MSNFDEIFLPVAQRPIVRDNFAFLCQFATELQHFPRFAWFFRRTVLPTSSGRRQVPLRPWSTTVPSYSFSKERSRGGRELSAKVTFDVIAGLLLLAKEVSGAPPQVCVLVRKCACASSSCLRRRCREPTPQRARCKMFTGFRSFEISCGVLRSKRLIGDVPEIIKTINPEENVRNHWNLHRNYWHNWILHTHECTSVNFYLLWNIEVTVKSLFV